MANTATKTASRRRVAPECTPRRVAAAVDALYAESLSRPELGERPSWAELEDWYRWRIGWYERMRLQWSRLGEWALATGQPRAVWRAALEAEWRADHGMVQAEAQAARCARNAVRFGPAASRAVA